MPEAIARYVTKRPGSAQARAVSSPVRSKVARTMGESRASGRPRVAEFFAGIGLVRAALDSAGFETETEGESRGETVAAYREALQEIATRPTVERNPDGDDQAAETMQLLARETLAAHGELRPAMPNMPEGELRVRKPAHNDAKERGE